MKPHTCRICGHEWESLDLVNENGETIEAAKVGRGIEVSAKSNGEGPLCHLCFFLYFAAVYAEHRGTTLRGAVENYEIKAKEYECSEDRLRVLVSRSGRRRAES